MSEEMQIPDQELVGRFRQGDEAAFDQLVHRYQSMVVNMAYQYILQHEEAVEAAQDVFVKVYQNLKDFRGDSSFKTWLYTITRRTVLNRLRHLKSRGRGRTDSLDDENFVRHDEALHTAEDPSTESLGAERHRMILEAIDELSEDYKEVIILREIQGLSYEEVAEVAGCRLGTVKSRLLRAREQLQQKLRRMGVVP